jgi:hypothetical protein
MLPPRVFYHLWADGAWSEPLIEHAAAMRQAGLDRAAASVVVGVVGADANRVAARITASHLLARARVTFVEAETGWEQVTLAAVADAAAACDGEAAFLYCHSKGAMDDTPVNAAWRRAMTGALVSGWRRCLDLLDGAETVGCHWLTPEQWPACVSTPFWGGNFWWARASYLARLPPLANRHRHDAEAWVGSGEPRPAAADLSPGWPAYQGGQ